MYTDRKLGAKMEIPGELKLDGFRAEAIKSAGRKSVWPE